MWKLTAQKKYWKTYNYLFGYPLSSQWKKYKIISSCSMTEDQVPVPDGMYPQVCECELSQDWAWFYVSHSSRLISNIASKVWQMATSPP